MDLPKKYHWNLKFIVMLITLILAISSISNGSAQVYHFVEDFSGVPDEDWVFSGINWTVAFTNISHTFTFDNELVSAGDPNSNLENHAVLNDNTAFGAWSFDIFIPSNSVTNTRVNRNFAVYMWSIPPSTYPDEPNTTLWPAFSVSGDGDKVRMFANNATNSRIRESIDSGLKFDIYQRFDIIRTLDYFYVYIDEQLVIDTEFPSNIGPEINYFSLTAPQGSGIKFDNFKITEDYEKVCDDLSCPPPPGPTFPPIVWAGIGVVAVVTTFGTWQYFKKKGMKN